MISIIIPVLNEAEGIEKLLRHLHAEARKPDELEIIVVDGGSADTTRPIVKELTNKISGIRLLTSEKGRARQMNHGARAASHSILYFLHADSFPPTHYDQLIRNQIAQGRLAGCFRMKFDSNNWWLRFVGWLTRFSWRACRGGDQSLFIQQALFEAIDGYDENFVIYEDIVLINELYARREFSVISEWLTTSARRYRTNGIFKLQYHFLMIYMKRWFGASPESLQRYYTKHIVS